ncbi:MAG: propanediol utilization protein [Actinomycetota bacterium]|jgi:hypothetical protein
MPTEPVQYGDLDELPHDPGADPAWQESVFLHWYDPKVGVGGVHRIGHEVPAGVTASWCGVVSRDGTRFRRNQVISYRPEDRLPDGFAAGPGQQLTFDPHPRLRVKEDGCELDLVVNDFYPRTDFFPKDSSVSEEFAAHHFEASGGVTGIAVLGGATYEINGFAHRDHSWGPRRWDTLLSHRWVSGTFGPALSFGSIAWHATDGTLLTVGYLVRDGEVSYADVDIVVHMEADGLTHRGGEVTWRTADGEQLTLFPKAVDGVLSMHRGVAAVDTLCEVEHDGRIGACDFEISTNPRAGAGPVLTALRALASDGLSLSSRGTPPGPRG